MFGMIHSLTRVGASLIPRRKVFELVTGQPPFDNFLLTPAKLLPQMREFATDEIPERWMKKWQILSEKTPDGEPTTTLREWLKEVYAHDDRRPEISDHDLDKLSELVGLMLKLEPSSRPTAREILDNPFFNS